MLVGSLRGACISAEEAHFNSTFTIISLLYHRITGDICETANESHREDQAIVLITRGTRNHLVERLRLLFGGMPARVQVAALPWRVADGECEIMLITSRDSGRWVLPKGWPEKREQPYEAAAREAMEEAGVDGAIAHGELGSFYYGKQMPSGMRWRCEVHVFPLEVDRIANKWPERKVRTRQWFKPAEAAALVNEPDLREMIAGFGLNPRKSVA
jgi:8-oxo-dGTP pyrophosphatase MutT (NUDIX family)